MNVINVISNSIEDNTIRSTSFSHEMYNERNKTIQIIDSMYVKFNDFIN